MIREDKELLLKDLCARLPYSIMFKYKERAGDYPHYHVHHVTTITINGAITGIRGGKGDVFHIEDLKPYLRQMSSMTKEEIKEYHSLCYYYYGTYFDSADSIDWLNSHHFDYRGLIEKGLALEAPEGMYE